MTMMNICNVKIQIYILYCNISFVQNIQKIKRRY